MRKIQLCSLSKKATQQHMAKAIRPTAWTNYHHPNHNSYLISSILHRNIATDALPLKRKRSYPKKSIFNLRRKRILRSQIKSKIDEKRSKQDAIQTQIMETISTIDSKLDISDVIPNDGISRNFYRIKLGRRTPQSFAYKALQKVKLDISPEITNEINYDSSLEKSRNEEKLKEYLSKLYKYTQAKRHARPINPKGDIPWKPLYNYKGTKTSEVDQRPSYIKFMQDLKEKNSQLYDELSKPIELNQLIDMSYLKFFENKDAPHVMNDDEYPNWVWELVPESRRYWWTDLIQTPFENLSEMEKWRLFRKWRKTLMVANNLWVGSELGKYGKVRPSYSDPWPSPITKPDIWDDEFYNNQNYKDDNFDIIDDNDDNNNTFSNDFESDLPRTKKTNFILNSGNNYKHAKEQTKKRGLDLEQFYGMKGNDISVEEDDNIPDGVVYKIKQ